MLLPHTVQRVTLNHEKRDKKPPRAQKIKSAIHSGCNIYSQCVCVCVHVILEQSVCDQQRQILKPEQRRATVNSLCPTPSTTIPSRAALPLFSCTGFSLVRLGSGPERRPVWELAGSAGSCALIDSFIYCLNETFALTVAHAYAVKGETETIKQRCGKDHENRVWEGFSLLLLLGA